MARRFVVVLSALLCASVAALGAEGPGDYCRAEALNRKNSDPASYGRRSGGYCDGAVFEPHSGSGELSVIGVSSGKINGDPGSSPVRIVAPVPTALAGEAPGTLRLQGVARSPTVNYRLDAGFSAGQTLAIGSESAMSQVDPHLRAEDVAWAAWSDDSEKGRTYVPVVLAGANGNDVEVVVVVRPTIPTAYLLYKVQDDSGRVVTEKNLEGSPLGEPVTLPVESATPRVLLVNVVAVGNDGGTQVANIRLIHPGSVRR